MTYPDKWVIVEAIQDYSKGNRRIIDELAVFGQYVDSMDSLRKHAELH